MTIRFKDCALYYKGLPHQDKAWEFLQVSVNPQVLSDFAEIYRTPIEPPKPTTPKDKILTRIKELGIALDKHPSGQPGFTTTIIAIEGCNPDFTLNNDAEDKYNDLMLAATVNGKGVVKLFKPIVCTTEPGRYYTRNRLNSAGAARLAIDYKHKSAWMKGSHKGQTHTLVQIGGPVVVYRDGNEDFQRTGDETMSGYFGINIHKNDTNSGTPSSIGRWSAGCIVGANITTFDDFMSKYVYNVDCINSKFSVILLDGSKIF